MSDLKKSLLRDHVDFLTGFPFKSKGYSTNQEDVKLLCGDNIAQGFFQWDTIKRWPKIDTENYARYLLREDDVVLAMDRPWVVAGLKFASMGSDDLPSLLLQRTARLRGSSTLDVNYLKYIIGSPWFTQYVKNINTGSLVPHISGDQIKDFSFPIPPITHQKRVARVLCTIDEKIELNNKINAELEAMARLIYDYWFVQFDFPDANGEPYKSSGGKMGYNETLKRDIPDGWSVNRLSEWIKSDKTGDWGKETAQGNYILQVDCIRGADINGLNGKGKVNAPNRYILKKNEHKILSPFDLIIEISGGSPVQSTGRMAFLTLDTLNRFKHPVISSNFCKGISLANNNYFYNFVYQWNAIYDNGILFGWEGKTSGIKNLLFDSFVSKHNVCFPPESLAKSFNAFIEPLQEKKQKSLKENTELESLRDWLLPMLMNGQVTVKDS